jgi:hydrogenase maturation protease
MKSDRILVACVGNIFMGDDGFGPAVFAAMRDKTLPPGVELMDSGIRGIHLAYELMDGCALFVLVDAAPHGAVPGTVSVIEVQAGTIPGAAPRPVIDAHGLAPDDVFALLDQLGARPARTLVVACEPSDVGGGMELSAPVREAVPHAVRAVLEIVERETASA